MRGMKIGIDFGSSSLKIVTESKGVVVDEPSVVAIEKGTGTPLAYGSAAFDLYGRTIDDIEIHKVIRNGVISDFMLAEKMLRYYLQRVCGNKIYKPNVVISVPSDASDLEKKIFLDAVTMAGAGRVCIVNGILASSFGCHIDENKLGGRMVIDIGHQITEFAVVSMGNIASNGTIRKGSDLIDKAILKHLRRDRDIEIGPHTVRMIKKKIVTAKARDTDTAMFISGKSIIDDMPISFEVSSSEIYPYVDEEITILIKDIHNLMSSIAPELLADASDHGIVLCGGGALIFDIAERMSEEIGIRCHVIDNPCQRKIIGLGKMIKNKELLDINNYSFIFKDDIKDRFNKFQNI